MRIGRSGQKALFATRSHESCCAVRHATVSCPSRLINTLQSRGACPQLPVALLLTALSCPDRVGKLVIVTLHGRTTQLQSGPRDCLPSDGYKADLQLGAVVGCSCVLCHCCRQVRRRAPPRTSQPPPAPRPSCPASCPPPPHPHSPSPTTWLSLSGSSPDVRT